MRLLILLCAALVLHVNSSAQLGGDFDYDVRVILGDGSSIMGQLISHDLHSVQMKLSTGDTMEIEFGYIKTLMGLDDGLEMHPLGDYHFNQGIYLDFSASIATGGAEASSHFNILGAKRLSNSTSFGFGIGLDTYQRDFSSSNFSYISTFAYGRYYLNRVKSRNRPFLSLGIGYGAAENIFHKRPIQEGTYVGGFAAKPTLGIHFASKKKRKILLGWAWHFQNSEAFFTNPEWWWGPTVTSVSEKLWFIRTGISLSLEFN